MQVSWILLHSQEGLSYCSILHKTHWIPINWPGNYNFLAAVGFYHKHIGRVLVQGLLCINWSSKDGNAARLFRLSKPWRCIFVWTNVSTLWSKPSPTQPSFPFLRCGCLWRWPAVAFISLPKALMAWSSTYLCMSSETLIINNLHYIFSFFFCLFRFKYYFSPFIFYFNLLWSPYFQNFHFGPYTFKFGSFWFLYFQNVLFGPWTFKVTILVCKPSKLTRTKVVFKPNFQIRKFDYKRIKGQIKAHTKVPN